MYKARATIKATTENCLFIISYFCSTHTLTQLSMFACHLLRQWRENKCVLLLYKNIMDKNSNAMHKN